MPRWEYEIVTVNDDPLYYGDDGSEQAVLEFWGDAGWELVSVLESGLGNKRLTYFYFKRPVMSTEASHA